MDGEREEGWKEDGRVGEWEGGRDGGIREGRGSREGTIAGRKGGREAEGGGTEGEREGRVRTCKLRQFNSENTVNPITVMAGWNAVVNCIGYSCSKPGRCLCYSPVLRRYLQDYHLLERHLHISFGVFKECRSDCF